MEDKALDILRIMFERRKLSTDTQRITSDDKKMERVTLYTIGTILVAFSQKDKMLANDIHNIMVFANENGHTTGVTIIALSPPSVNVLKVAKSYSKDRVAFFHIQQLQFDIMTHRMAVPHRILSEDEKTKVFDRYKISDPENQLPWIDSQETMMKWIGAVPGDVIEVSRHSDTAGKSLYYRYCVEDVNIAQ